MTTRGIYKSLARELTSVLSTTELSDVTLTSFVQESVNEIYRKHGSGWGFALTPLIGDLTVTAFEDQFDGAVVYRTAAKILKNINDTTNRADYFLQEYQLIVADMEKYYLSALVNPGLSGGITGLTTLSSAVRAVTGVYDTQVMSAGMMQQLVNVAYTEILNYRDWRNWTAYYQESLPAWTDAEDHTYSVSCHKITLETQTFTHAVNAGAPTIKGVLVKEVNLVTGGASGRMQRIMRTDSLAGVSENSNQIFYTVEQDHATGEVHMLIAPEQSVTNTFVRFVTADKEPSRITDSSYFEIPEQFNMMLVYRAAQLVLQQIAPEDPRIVAYGDNFASLLDAFTSYDQLNHDTSSFSIGEEGKATPGYLPWFKPA